MKDQAAEGAQRFETGAEEYNDINNEIPVSFIDPIGDTSETGKAALYTVCQTRDNN